MPSRRRLRAGISHAPFRPARLGRSRAGPLRRTGSPMPRLPWTDGPPSGPKRRPPFRSSPASESPMIRAIVFIVLLALLAVGLGWLADRPGTIALTWEGWQVRTSMMTAAIVLLVGIVVLLLVFALLRSLLR